MSGIAAAINDGGEFDKLYNETCPPELELKHKYRRNSKTSFKDIDKKIVNKTFSLNLYNNRNIFPFSTIRMPSLS